MSSKIKKNKPTSGTNEVRGQKSRPFLAITASKRLIVRPHQLRKALNSLRRSQLRYCISSFLKDGLEIVAFVDLTSSVEQTTWEALKNKFR